MKICSKCGKEMSDFARFCPKCGSPSAGTSDIVEHDYDENVVATIRNDFISPDEQVLATLGNGYGVNALFGKVRKCQSVITEKRVYFRGVLYTDDGKKLIKKESKKIINVEDITGTGFNHSAFSLLGLLPYIPVVVLGIIGGIYFGPETQHSWLIAWGCYIGAALAGIGGFLIQYYKSKFTLFEIEYPGGIICFDAHLVGLSDVSDFQKQIYRAKDKLKKN